MTTAAGHSPGHSINQVIQPLTLHHNPEKSEFATTNPINCWLAMTANQTSSNTIGSTPAAAGCEFRLRAREAVATTDPNSTGQSQFEK